MLNKLFDAAKNINVTIIFLENFDEKGCFLPEYDVIYLKTDLKDQELIYVLTHELCHAYKHKGYCNEYLHSFIYKTKLEYEAEIDAIKASIANYFAYVDSVEPNDVNYLKFMETYEIDTSLEPCVKRLLLEYIGST